MAVVAGKHFLESGRSMSHRPALGVLCGHLRRAQEAWSAAPAIKASPGQALTGTPVVQADTGSRNANKAGWRALLRARVLGRQEAAGLGKRPAQGPGALDNLVSLPPRLPIRPLPPDVMRASRIFWEGSSPDGRFSKLIPDPAPAVTPEEGSEAQGSWVHRRPA